MASESRTVAEALVDRLIEWGVTVVFGLPGDGINGIMESLRTRKDKIRFVQVRHEESAAFMACAYAKYTGRLGVCLATSGPGGLHLINGLYDAKLDGQPVLAITGHHYHDLIDTFAQQDVDLDRVFQDVALYSTRVMGRNRVAAVTKPACWEPSPPSKSWKGATRSSWWARHSRTSSSCPSPARRAECNSTSTPSASACAIRSRWASSAMPRRRCACSSLFSTARATARS